MTYNMFGGTLNPTQSINWGGMCPNVPYLETPMDIIIMVGGAAYSHSRCPHRRPFFVRLL